MCACAVIFTSFTRVHVHFLLDSVVIHKFAASTMRRMLEGSTQKKDPSVGRPDPPTKKNTSAMSVEKKLSPQVWKSHHANDGLIKYGGRDLFGYGEKTPIPKWPGYGKVALNFVINYEEGGEKCLLHGDKESENLLSEIVGATALGRYREREMDLHEM